MSSIRTFLIVIALLGICQINTMATTLSPVDLMVPKDDTSSAVPVVTQAYFIGDVTNYIKTHMQYPVDAKAKGIQGAVVVSFQVSTSGAIENATVTKSVFPSLDAEALRIVNLMPAWAPAKQNSANVSSTCTVPILFKL